MQKRVPVYNTMFSELSRYPRYEVRLDTVDPVPRFIARQWRGQQTEAQDTALRFQRFKTFVFCQLCPILLIFNFYFLCFVILLIIIYFEM